MSLVKESLTKFQKGVRLLFVFLPLIVVIDFILPGITRSEKVLSVSTESQYWHKGRRSTFSTRLYLDSFQTYISEELGSRIDTSSFVDIETSLLFSRIKSVKKSQDQVYEIYSLTWATHFFIPLCTLIFILFSFLKREILLNYIWPVQGIILANYAYLIFV